MEYRHTQWGWFWLPTMALFAVILIVAVQADDEMTPAVFGMIAALLVTILAVVLHFSRMTVTVDGEAVAAAFGSGWPRKVVPIAEITAVRRVRNEWWYGFGIRKVPGGWMYNVSGLDAVELELSSGKILRIGTDEPEALHGVLSLFVRS